MNQSQSSIAAFEASITKLEQYLLDQDAPRPLHEVEQELFTLVREVGRAALARYVAGCGTGDAGPVLEDASGHKRRRHGVRTRTYRSLFGAVEIVRMYYYEEFNGGLAPLDARMELPERSYSYPLQRLVCRLAATSAYDEAKDTLETVLGARVPKSMAEEIMAEHGADVRAFQTQLLAPVTVRVNRSTCGSPKQIHPGSANEIQVSSAKEIHLQAS